MKKIKLFDPVIGDAEQKAISKVLASKFWASGSGVGSVSEFESKFRKYIGSSNCVAVNSGTAALNLALSLSDIKNKEVVLPSLSFVSTAHAIVLNGGKPVFVDVDPNTLCIDPEKIKKAITKKTKMIIPVHFAGMASNMKKIIEISEQHNLTIVEDAAHAAGAHYENQKIGTHGMAVCFSFHPVKNLAMPSGGLISLNHKNFKKFRKILQAKRWCGITNRSGAYYDVKEMGWNYYMNEFSAAIGLVQLKKLNKMNMIRRKIAKFYDKKINIEKKIPLEDGCVYHLYWIYVKNRKKFRKQMTNIGIETGIHYNPIHKMSMYKQNRKLPITENAGKNIVSIPLHPNLTEIELEFIIESINRFS